MIKSIFRLYPGLFAAFFLITSCGGNKSGESVDTSRVQEFSEELVDFNESTPSSDPTLMVAETENTEKNIPPGVQALTRAYPDFIKGYENGEVIFSDGSRMIYDDGRQKGFTEMLDNSSLKDMFYVPYNGHDKEPEYLNDAGRSRNEVLFKKMYGSSQSEVSKKLVPVEWFGQRVQFTPVNGAAENLKKASQELAQYPEFRKYLKSSGSFYWRNVRRANRLSAHSYGIAIDLGVDQSDYWLWKFPKAGEEDKITYYNRFPKEIAAIMEKYGFIWGGGWYHFDTMHFEYRPEILEYAKIYSKQ